MIETIDATRLKEKRDANEDFVLLDVRSQEEFQLVNIGGTHIPLQDLPERFRELSEKTPIVVLCHHGVRSEQAASFLEAKGFKEVSHLDGGIDSWAIEVEPDLLRY